jgi:transposase
MESRRHDIDWRERAQRWRTVASGMRARNQALCAEVAALREENMRLRGDGKQLQTKLSGLEEQNDQLLRKVLGRTSEKMPPLSREIRDSDEERKKSSKKRRARNAEARAKLPSEVVTHDVADKDRSCPNCEQGEMRPMPPECSTEYEYVPARLVRRVHQREKLSCSRSCGFIITADGPPKVYDKARYGPRLIAHIATSKCADVLPLYRQAKQLQRLGNPIARSTLTDLFHRAASLCEPLVKRMEQLIGQSSHVLADETSFRIQDQGACRRGFIWTFIGAGLVLYCYSATRSGETPQRIVGGTTGKLLVDGYTGYNQVCDVIGRERAGCLCHLRRYFFEARDTAPTQAQHVFDVIAEVYRIEHKAKKAGILGTDAHLQLRQLESKPLMEGLEAWMVEQQPFHPPKSPLARAIRYGLNQWQALTQFLWDPVLPPDNNESERRLRLIALGRKSYLFAAGDSGAENLAMLMSLVVTCEAHGIDPEEYLADVLIRMQTHPQSRIDELLPPRWKEIRDAEELTDASVAVGFKPLAA